MAQKKNGNLVSIFFCKKAYFKRKSLKPKDHVLYSMEKEKAHWICLECGNEVEIDMPTGWKCPKCGVPKG